MRDLKNNVSEFALMRAKAFCGDVQDTDVASNGSWTGTVVDLKGEGRKLLLLVSVGASSTATANVILQDSSDNSTFETNQEVICDTAGLQVFDLATSRYIRIYATLNATTNISNANIELAVLGLVYNERYIPSNVA